VRMPLADLGNTKHVSELAHELMTDGVRAVSPNGILGDARNATAHHGQVVLDKLFADLAQFIDTSCSSWHDS
jgi:mycofactocin precursor peptide peptidase